MAAFEIGGSYSSYGFAPLRLADGMTVLNVGWNLAPLSSGGHADFLTESSVSMANRGANVIVVVPALNGINMNGLKVKKNHPSFNIDMRGIGNSRTTITEFGTDTLKVDSPRKLRIFSIENSLMRESDASSLIALMAYQRSLPGLFEIIDMDRGVVNFHDWQTGFGPAVLKDTLKRHGVRTVFTITEASEIVTFSMEQWPHIGLEGDLFEHPFMEFRHGMSPLKSGTEADLTLVLDRKLMDQLLKPSQKRASQELEQRDRDMAMHLQSLEDQDKLQPILFQKQIDLAGKRFPREMSAALTEIYRNLWPFYSLDLQAKIIHEMEDGRFTINNLVRNIQVPLSETERTEIILRSMRDSSSRVIKQVSDENIVVIGQGPETEKPRPATGSSIVGAMSDCAVLVGDNKKTILQLDGGEGTRNILVNLASGGPKGQVQILNTVLAEIATSQTVSIFSSLARRGLGWTVVTSNDNIYSTERLMVGKPSLSETDYGMIIFGVPKEIENTDPDSDEMTRLMPFGVLTADPLTGELSFIIEKPSREELPVLASKVKTSKNIYFKNTFFMAIRDDVRKLMVHLYGMPTKSADPEKAGKSLFELGLDFSRHILEPMCMTHDQWMTGKRKYGTFKEDKHVDAADWETIWQNAQMIKISSSGFLMRKDISEMMTGLTGSMDINYDNLDIVSHIIEPMFMTEAEWMDLERTDRNDIGLETEDWKAIWVMAQKVKDEAMKTLKGGIGVGSLGRSSYWVDTGSNPELKGLYHVLTGRSDKAIALRKAFGITEEDLGSDVIHCNFNPDTWKVPEEKHSFLVMNTVAKKGIKVGRNSVVVNCVFDEYIEIPDNTIMIGCRLGKIAVQTADELEQATGCIVYHLDNTGHGDASFSFGGASMVYSSVYVVDEFGIKGNKLNLQHAVNVDTKEKNAAGKEKFKVEKILIDMNGGERAYSFEELAPKVSLKLTQQAKNKRREDIEAYIAARP